ncbi:MAG: heavy metal translocating P-type ATPase [Gemmataceae bacterium]
MRLAIGIALAGHGMLLGLAVNLTPETSARLILQGIVLVSALIVVGLLGWPLMVSVARSLRHGRLTVEALFLTAMSGAMIASFQAVISGKGAIYFEVVSILLVIYSVNRFLAARTRNAAFEASRQWLKRLGQARKVDSGETKEVDVGTIVVDDVVEVRPGEWIPVDGTIVSGMGYVRDTPMTGEPFARVVRTGDRVLAGFAVEDALLQVRATADGNQREIDALLATVEKAQNTPISLQTQADKIARVFLPLILLACVLTFSFWYWQADWETGLLHAASVLLVACPCALGLAIPIAVWHTLGKMAERGLVTRRADLIENLASVDRVVFDKTGTLTEDEMTVVDVVTVSDGPDREKVLAWLAHVESHCPHPVARALAGLPVNTVDNAITDLTLRTVPGCGVEALFVDGSGQSRQLRIGSTDWLGQNLEGAESEVGRDLPAGDTSRIAVELDGHLEALCLLRERVRKSVSATKAELQGMGLETYVFTGDTAEHAAASGFPDAMASLSPLDKQRLVEEWQRQGHRLLFVGDGINDSAALSVSHAGIALSSGSQLALSASPATLYHSDLSVVAWSIRLSRQALGTIRGSLLWAACYNIVGITVAACGLLHPIFAAVLMLGSSMFISWRASRVGVASTDRLADISNEGASDKGAPLLPRYQVSSEVNSSFRT